jgi:hypothetical protein
MLQEIEKEQLDRAIRLAQAVKPLLEPAVAEAYLEDAGMLSLAISMKRIADFVCGHTDSEGLSRMDIVAYLGRELEDVAKR